MSKCGKGCMPECKYFTTGGCISPFNCPYKIETGHINSATSTTDSLTGLLMEFDEMGLLRQYRALDPEKYAIEGREKVRKEIERLKSENDDLRERLDKAEQRVQVAERALLTACVNLIKDEKDNVNMELLAHVVYTKFLRKAEKELAEGRKDDRERNNTKNI